MGNQQDLALVGGIHSFRKMKMAAFHLATRAACSEAAGSDCTAQYESCKEPFLISNSTNGSICDCYPPYKSCMISAGCTDSVTRELFTTQCENDSCSCSWGAAGLPRGNWMHALASAASEWLSSSPSSSSSFFLSSLSSIINT